MTELFAVRELIKHIKSADGVAYSDEINFNQPAQIAASIGALGCILILGSNWRHKLRKLLDEKGEDYAYI